MCFRELPHKCKRQHTLIALCHNLGQIKTQSVPLFQAELNLLFSISQPLGSRCNGAVTHLLFPVESRCVSRLLSLYLLHLFTLRAFGLCCVLADTRLCVYFSFLFISLSFGFICMGLVASKGPVSSTASSSSSSSTPRAAGAGASQSPAYQATHSLALPLAQGEQSLLPPPPPPLLPSLPPFTSSLYLPVWWFLNQY